MAEIKISALPSIVTPSTTDLYPVVQGGVTYSEEMSQLITLVGAHVTIGESQVTNLTSDLSARLLKSNNLSDVNSTSTALSNLGGLPLAGGTMTGNLILNGDPTLALQAVTKQYADSIGSGFTQHAAVAAASTVNLVGTYNNGTLGVGATFTVTATGVTLIDGYTPSTNDRIMLKNQSTGFQNGVYTVTTPGSSGVSLVLTRATDFNTATAGNVAAGANFPITGGSTNINTSWYLSGPGPYTIGTTALVFVALSVPTNYTPGNGIAISSNVISAAINSTNLQFTGGNINTIQNIATSSSPQFTGLNLSGLTANRLASTDGSKNIASSSISSWLVQGTNMTITDNGNGTATLSATTGGISGFHPGSVIFANNSGNPTENNSQFFWDQTYLGLGLSTNTPDIYASLTIGGVGKARGISVDFETTVSDAQSEQVGINCSPVFAPSGGATASFSSYNYATFRAPMGQTITTIYGGYTNYDVSTNVGSINNIYGHLFDSGFGNAGSLGNSTTILVKTPGNTSASNQFTACFVDTNSNPTRIGIGTPNPDPKCTMEITTTIPNSGGITNSLYVTSYNPNSPRNYLARSANGSSASPSSLNNGNTLGEIDFMGYTASGWPTLPSAGIIAIANQIGGFTFSNQGTDIYLYNTYNSGANYESLHSYSNGNITIGVNFLDINANTGYLYVPAFINGGISNPGGVPQSISGYIPCCFQPSVHQFQFYANGRWYAISGTPL